MSQSTPTFVVKMTVAGHKVYSSQAWPTKHVGRPSASTLKRFVEEFEASTRPGGCNAHLGPEIVQSACIIRQATQEVVCTYEQPIIPMFEVIA